MPRTSPNLLHRLVCATAGVAAVEAAFTLPVLLAFGFGITETGRAIWIQNQLQFAVEAAARCRAIDTTNCASDTATQNYAVGQMPGYTVPASTFVVTSETCGTKVAASLNFFQVVSGLVPLNLTLTASSCHP